MHAGPFLVLLLFATLSSAPRGLARTRRRAVAAAATQHLPSSALPRRSHPQGLTVPPTPGSPRNRSWHRACHRHGRTPRRRGTRQGPLGLPVCPRTTGSRHSHTPRGVACFARPHALTAHARRRVVVPAVRVPVRGGRFRRTLIPSVRLLRTAVGSAARFSFDASSPTRHRHT